MVDRGVGTRWTAVCGAAAALALLQAAAAEEPDDAAAPDPFHHLELVPVRDADERAEVSLPRGAEAHGRAAASPDVLQIWTFDLDGKPPRDDAIATLAERPQFSRALHAGSLGFTIGWGELVPGSVRATGDSWTEERKDAAIGGRFLVRLVETDDMVYAFIFQCREADWLRLRSLAHRVTDTFRGLSGFRPRPQPEGYTTFEHDGAEVVTDVGRGELRSMLREYSAAAKAAGKLVSGSPAMRSPPRLVLHRERENYAKAWVAQDGELTAPLYLDSMDRAVHVHVPSAGAGMRSAEFHNAVGELLLARHFGGLPPPWVGDGLAFEVAVTVRSGKPDAPGEDLIRKAKQAAWGSDSTLLDLLAVNLAPSGDAAHALAYESYAWHFFFRHGAGRKSYGKRYQETLEALRKTGDARAMRTPWEDLDGAVLRREFLDWVQRWKEGMPR